MLQLTATHIRTCPCSYLSPTTCSLWDVLLHYLRCTAHSYTLGRSRSPTMLKHYASWASEASPPSGTTGTIFLYIYICVVRVARYLNVSTRFYLSVDAVRNIAILYSRSPTMLKHSSSRTTGLTRASSVSPDTVSLLNVSTRFYLGVHAVRNIATTVCMEAALGSTIDCKHSGLPPQG